MASSTDVPGKFDVVINGEGYRFLEEDKRAAYGYSPTFVQRSNVQGKFGDNFQDFWLTFSQNDWSLGDGQRHAKIGDEVADRRFYASTNLDILTPGSVTLNRAVRVLTAGTTVTGAAKGGSATAFLVDTTNVRSVVGSGTVTDHGAHGLGTTPSTFGAACDGTDLYITTTSASTVGVCKWDGSSFSTFSASPADSLEFLNNTLYGLRNDTSKLVRWDTSGNQTELYQWKQADGGARGGKAGRILAYGGKLLIVWSSGGPTSELWQYDGEGVSLIASFPSNFFAYDATVCGGIAFISGSFLRADGSNYYAKPAVFWYVGGQSDLLWQGKSYDTTGYAVASIHAGPHPGVAAFETGVAITDSVTGHIFSYDIFNGGTHELCALATASKPNRLIGTNSFIVATKESTDPHQFPNATTTATSGTVTSSLVDFDSSLSKLFRGITVDFDAATDGNGGSIDIAYRVGDVDGSYTTLQTGAVSGTEYTLSGVSGRSLSVKLTVNKGTSTDGPKLKRVFVRAAPVQQSFKRRQYLLDLSGRDGQEMLQLRDGTQHTKDGMSMAQDLNTAASATSPFTVTDRFGSYTAIIEADGFELQEVHPEVFVASVRCREV